MGRARARSAAVRSLPADSGMSSRGSSTNSIRSKRPVPGPINSASLARAASISRSTSADSKMSLDKWPRRGSASSNLSPGSNILWKKRISSPAARPNGLILSPRFGGSFSTPKVASHQSECLAALNHVQDHNRAEQPETSPHAELRHFYSYCDWKRS